MLSTALACRRIDKLLIVFLSATLGSTALRAQNGAGTTSAKMMSKDARPIFDVATIKASDPNSRIGAGLDADGRHISYTNQTVKDLVLLAYGIQEEQLADAPAWLGTEKYDIDGVPDTEGIPNLWQMQAMFRKLLADRFNLKVHKEKKNLAVYALTLGKGGAKIAKSVADLEGLPHQNMRPTAQLVTLRATNASIADFMLEMQEVLDKPLVDQTGLAGRFDFALQWTPDESQLSALGVHVSPILDNLNAVPGLFTAIQEQLGMKLVPEKAPVDVLAIDRVERPSAN